jgi:hypothetical protein
MVIFGILMIAGIIIRWNYVSGEITDAFGRLFSEPQQEHVEQSDVNGTIHENTDN